MAAWGDWFTFPMSQILNRPRNESRSGQRSALQPEHDRENKASYQPPRASNGLPEWPLGTENGVKLLAPMRLKDEIEDIEINTTRLHVAEIMEDLRLAQSVERELRMTGHLPLNAIQVFADGRVVILQGHVPSYHLKHVAETTTLSVIGVEELRNDLEVVAGETKMTGNVHYWREPG
jgi:hypothetical protein